MKALSPIIAVVLLIAFTVAVGGLIGIFLTGLTKSQTETTEEKSEKTTKCLSIIQIDEVKTNSSTLNPVNITLTYSQGTEDLYNFTVYIKDSADYLNSTSDLTPNYNTTNPFKPGMQTVWRVDTTNWDISGSLKLVRVVGFCQTDYPVADECESGDPCMK